MIALNGREVDMGSIVLGDVRGFDYPDFVDAYIEEAYFVDGDEMSEEEIIALEDANYGLVNELALKQYMGGF